MKKVYKEESAELPIRFGTLDFDLLCENHNGRQILSKVCLDSVVQAYFVSMEKINNRMNPKNRKIYFRIE